ncbi:response regulator transcription factor [Thioalkalivibrio sp. XN279]|uniref:response regulator transcription factor n=1 Tax=Thioalkalivibrio sp. XN279 TaxID=2714953 RepID=UPI001408CADF|nr:response regulator transcription factor [Thioalkalivibrio sp. XN279]NHA15999.1 response regulator transcription factor [Thioalkalivibrio sp. XN279]
MKILLVEDDELLGDGIRAGLMLASFAVDWVRRGDLALAALADHDYDACVLDLGLPGKDGIAVLQQLRRSDNPLPVLVLTARGRREDKIRGLDSGADDYMTKPFDLEELLARLRALLRRSSGMTSPVIRHGAIELDPVSRRVHRAGEEVHLSGREYAVLLDFLTHPQHIRSRSQLEDSLYAWGEGAGSNTIEVYIHHLRKKLGPGIIVTHRGRGYRLGEPGQ